MTTTEQITKLGEGMAEIETAVTAAQTESKTNRKKLKAHLESLSRPQLIAVATQKKVMPYRVATGHTHEYLVMALLDVEGLLKAVPA